MNGYENKKYSTRCQFRQKFIGKGFNSIEVVQVFMQHRVQNRKAKCAKTVIAYKMKTVHELDFLKALLICKSTISYTFVI